MTDLTNAELATTPDTPEWRFANEIGDAAAATGREILLHSSTARQMIAEAARRLAAPVGEDERERIADLICAEGKLDRPHDPNCANRSEHLELADAILAAGYRKRPAPDAIVGYRVYKNDKFLGEFKTMADINDAINGKRPAQQDAVQAFAAELVRWCGERRDFIDRDTLMADRLRLLLSEVIAHIRSMAEGNAK